MAKRGPANIEGLSEHEVLCRRFDILWPSIRADMLQIRDYERHLSGAAALGAKLRQNIAPPAAPNLIGKTINQVLEHIPSSVEHLVVLPWLGLHGGSDRVSRLFIRALIEHYPKDRFCILGLDQGFNPTPEVREQLDCSLVSIDEFCPSASFEDRVDILDRILIQRSPPTVHTINSYAAWQLIKERGRHFASSVGFFGHIYADIRVEDVALEVFWQYLPDCLDHMKGVISDNRRIATLAERNFGLGRADIAKFFVVYTPILDVPPSKDTALRPYSRNMGPPSALWFGRFSPEKRPELVAETASLLPDWKFAMYGQQLAAMDMQVIRCRPNVELRGVFDSLNDLPFETFDAYLLTSSAEGMPLAMLEATRFGLPVVAPDVGAVHEFLSEETGWLVPAPAVNSPDGFAALLAAVRKDFQDAARKVECAQRVLLERHAWPSFTKTLADIPGYLRPV
jgi:glycosyltransferase involved in cell wall biosynthesis